MLDVKIFIQTKSYMKFTLKRNYFPYTPSYLNIYLIQTFKFKKIIKGRKRALTRRPSLVGHRNFYFKATPLRPTDNLPKTSVAFLTNSKTPLQII